MELSTRLCAPVAAASEHARVRAPPLLLGGRVIHCS